MRCVLLAHYAAAPDSVKVERQTRRRPGLDGVLVLEGAVLASAIGSVDETLLFAQSGGCTALQFSSNGRGYAVVVQPVDGAASQRQRSERLLTCPRPPIAWQLLAHLGCANFWADRLSMRTQPAGKSA